LFHGHEPLDTDSTPNLEGEDWLMHNGYTQAEGVANLDQVPEAGALVVIGYPKFAGGLGGYAPLCCSLSVRLALWCHDRAARRDVAEVG
jgi:kynurenine formamidase